MRSAQKTFKFSKIAAIFLMVLAFAFSNSISVFLKNINAPEKIIKQMSVWQAQAAITEQQAWSSVYSGVAFPGTYSYTVNAGSNRMLIVGVSSLATAAVSQTATVTYGGQSLAQQITDGAVSARQHTWLFYLKDTPSVMNGASHNLVVTVTGGTAAYNHVYAAVYAGADQSASPITDSKNYNSGGATDNIVGPFSPALTINAGDQTVEMINITRLGNKNARTISGWAANWSGELGPNSGNNGTDSTSAYAATNTTAGATASQHTASGNVIRSMSAMSIKAVPATDLAAGSDPAATSIGPGAAATDVDQFTLTTNIGTETITSVTVNLSTNNGIDKLTITDNANTVLGSLASGSLAVGSNTIAVSGMSAGTSTTTFKVRVTPLPHGLMAVPPGGSYAVTAPVTAWAGNIAIHTGGDTNTNALTIDNTSPNGATLVSGSALVSAITINWTTSNSADFNTSSGSVILRWTSASAGAEVPAEGSLYAAGNTIGTATVACVISSAASSAQSKTNGTGGSAGCSTTALTNGQNYTYKVFQKDTSGNYDVGVLIGTFRPGAIVTVGSTAGSKIANLNSSEISKYANNTSCNGSASCSAFTLSINSGSDTVTSIAVSQTGTVVANTALANLALFYDTDGNYSNGVTGQYGSTVASFNAGQTATVSGSLLMSSGTTYYFYVRFDLANGSNYPVGGQTVNFQITSNSDVAVSGGANIAGAPKALAGTLTVLPKLISYTNSTESGLNYAAACTSCGARLGAGAFKQTLNISGYGFGADPGSGNRDTASNKVEIVGASTTVIQDAGAGDTNITAWSNTSITITTDTAVTGNSDASWGTNFGGAAALKITAGSQAAAANLNFYVLPQITSLTVPTAISDAAREYDAADSDGIITLNGTRFGTSRGTGWVRILGCDSGTCSSPAGSVAVNSWNNTAITVQVPTVISNSVYTGSVVVQQGTGGNSKTHTYANTFRILPRITSLSPNLGPEGLAVTVNGDHLCQTGACPSSFSANNKVTFSTGVSATVFTSWSHTAMVTAVPAGADSGGVTITSNSYISNEVTFTVTIFTGNTCAPYHIRQTVTLYGMIATSKRYGFAYTDGTGYQNRNLTYDANLLYGPPPSFPLTSDQYTILSWEEIEN